MSRKSNNDIQKLLGLLAVWAIENNSEALVGMKRGTIDSKIISFRTSWKMVSQYVFTKKGVTPTTQRTKRRKKQRPRNETEITPMLG